MHPTKVTKTALPAFSTLHERRQPGDFLDCYTVTAAMPVHDAADIITDFPHWARFLLWMRRIVTTPFGLDNDGPKAADRIGIFPVETETCNELIAGFDDRHLNFRVSVLSDDARISLATWVSPHNLGGRAYLASIMPVHVAIARNALLRVRQAMIDQGELSMRGDKP